MRSEKRIRKKKRISKKQKRKITRKLYKKKGGSRGTRKSVRLTKKKKDKIEAKAKAKAKKAHIVDEKRKTARGKILYNLRSKFPKYNKKPGETIFTPEAMKAAKELLLYNDYYTDTNVDEFLTKNNIVMKDNSVNGKQKLTKDGVEAMKEINIACFTNFYRKEIIKIVNSLNFYLHKILGDGVQPIGYVVLSGGSGLNQNLLPGNRIVSPDMDFKFILNPYYCTGDRRFNWMNYYLLGVCSMIYFMDWIVYCLNPVNLSGTFTEYPLNPPWAIIEESEIKDLIYMTNVRGETFMKINEPGKDYSGFFLEELADIVQDPDESIGDNNIVRRTQFMDAGGKELPFKYYNVLLTSMDIKFIFGSFFGNLPGFIDLVVTSPGHIGHNDMILLFKDKADENESGFMCYTDGSILTEAEYLAYFEHPTLPETNFIYSINMKSYIKDIEAMTL